MNIFVLDNNPRTAAVYHCDKHVPKMVVELYQQMGSAVIRHGAIPNQMPLTSKGTPLRGGYHNHPCTRWVGETRSNFIWASVHGLALCEQYYLRYKKTHSCLKGIQHLYEMASIVPDGGLTPFAQAMPDEFKNSDTTKAYRNYYLGAKKSFAKWDKLNNKPHWWNL